MALLLVLTLPSCSRDRERGNAAAPDTVGLGLEARGGIPEHAPALARRADSLQRLDPEREARAAITRGDLRFIAVCGYACNPVGVPLDSALRSPDSLAVLGDSVRPVPGTSDAVANRDVARLNLAAAAYAGRYNRVIWAHRIQMRATRPAT